LPVSEGLRNYSAAAYGAAENIRSRFRITSLKTSLAFYQCVGAMEFNQTVSFC